MSPAEILRKARVLAPINKVTLYRILDLYESCDIVRRILSAGRAARYELVDPRNTGKKKIEPHFVCRMCRKVIPIKIPSLQSLVEGELQKEYGSPLDVAVAGVCRKCRKKI
jgi:Fe2+ or Zn2+ uptake regulation protein